jgi:hypothetical protein
MSTWLTGSSSLQHYVTDEKQDHGSICRIQSAVAVRGGAGSAGAKQAFFARSSPTGWTTDSEYLLGAEFLLHGEQQNARKPTLGMVNYEHSRAAKQWLRFAKYSAEPWDMWNMVWSPTRAAAGPLTA